MADIAALNVIIGANIDEFERAMNQAERGIGRLGQGLKTAGAGLTAALTLPLGILGGAALAAAGDIQALEKGFAATYKGGEQLSVALAKVKELAKLPGLGLKEALQGATNLQAAGFSADLAARALGAFGNALATVGKGKADLNGVGLALSQIASKGKISAEEINQLAERVPQIRVAMQAAFGTADTEVLQKLGISATAFVEGVTKELEKLPKVSGGINNAFENLADSGTIALSKLGTSLNNAFNIEGTLGKLGDFITGLADKFEALDPATQKTIFALAGVAAAAGPLLFALGSIGVAVPAITAGFAVLGVTTVAALAPVLGIAAAVAAAAVLVYQNWERVAPLFTDIGLTISGLADSIQATFGGISSTLDAFGINTGNLGGVFKTLGGAVVDFLVAPLRLLAGALDVAVGGTRVMIALFLGDFRSALGGAGQVLDGLKLALFNIHKEAANSTFAEFFKDLKGPIEEVTGLMSGDLAGALPVVTTLTKEQAAALAKLRKEADDAARALQKLNEGYENMAPRRIIKPQDAPEFKLATPGLGALPTVLQPINVEPFRSSLQEASAEMKLFQLTAETFSDGLSRVLEQGVADIAVGFGQGIGNILSGAGGLEDLGAILLGALGGVAIQIGQLAIGTGIAVAGIKAALQSLNPAAAIIGGIALVALGTAVKGAASGIASRGGGGGGGAGGSALGSSAPAPTRFTPTAPPNAVAQGPSTVTHNVVFNLQGNNLLAALNIETDRLGRVTGRR